MFLDPNVDVVSICVKVPDHRDLVLGALAAGKHLYCEWPLGRDLAEARELAAAADAGGVHAAAGLQTRMNPAAQHARSLIASGRIGRPLSARIYGGGALSGSAPRPVLPAVIKLLARNFAFWTGKKTVFYYISRDSKRFVPDLETLFQLLQRGKLTVPIKSTVPLAEIQRAHREWAKGSGMGSILIEVQK